MDRRVKALDVDMNVSSHTTILLFCMILIVFSAYSNSAVYKMWHHECSVCALF